MPFARSKHLVLAKIATLTLLATFVASSAVADEMREEYSAHGLALGSTGHRQTIDIVITRWSTADERGMLLKALAEKGQKAVISLLMKQPETGFVRRRDGRNIEGQASVRLHYAFEWEHDDNRRTVVLVTKRPIGVLTEVTQRGQDHATVSGIILELEEKGDSEKGTGIVHRGVTISLDPDTQELKLETQALPPFNLRSVIRNR